MKCLAIGDIHTKMWILEEVESRIGKYDAVVFVGDYADDWNTAPIRTIETYKRLHDFQVKYYNKVHVVMGNHDYIYVNYTKSISSGYNRTTQLLLDLPENKKYKAWIKAMPTFREIDGVIYSHAGITETWNQQYDSVSLWKDDSPLWARPATSKYKQIPQVFGHNPSATCWEINPNIWCIDTFSTYPDGSPIGDCSMLEINYDGILTTFKKVETKNDNNSTTRIKR